MGPADRGGRPCAHGDPILNLGAAYVGDMVDALGSMAMGGRVDLAVLSAAEVDRYGNLNTLLIGDPAEPDIRFPGTGGNTDATCTVRRTLLVMSLEPRRFVEKVSFLTSPGYVDGPGARQAAGLDPQGPNLVVCTLGVFDFDTPDRGVSGSCEMRLAKLYPGVDASTTEAIVPWPLLVAPTLETCARPSANELALLRKLDPGSNTSGKDATEGCAGGGASRNTRTEAVPECRDSWRPASRRRIRKPASGGRLESDLLEATGGFEPPIGVLQTPALTTWPRRPSTSSGQALSSKLRELSFGAEEGI